MISKQFRIAVSLLTLAAIVSLPASAGQLLRKAKPEPLRMRKIHNLAASASLTIAPGWRTPGVKIVADNNTGVTFLAGAKVYWSIIGSQASSQSEKTGWFILQRALSPGDRITYIPPVPASYVPASEVKVWIP